MFLKLPDRVQGRKDQELLRPYAVDGCARRILDYPDHRLRVHPCHGVHGAVRLHVRRAVQPRREGLEELFG